MIYHHLPVHSIDRCLEFSGFLLYRYCHCENSISCPLMNKYSYLLLLSLSIYLELLGHKVCICSVLVDTIKLFSKGVIFIPALCVSVYPYFCKHLVFFILFIFYSGRSIVVLWFKYTIPPKEWNWASYYRFTDYMDIVFDDVYINIFNQCFWDVCIFWLIDKCSLYFLNNLFSLYVREYLLTFCELLLFPLRGVFWYTDILNFNIFCCVNFFLYL